MKKTTIAGILIAIGVVIIAVYFIGTQIGLLGTGLSAYPNSTQLSSANVETVMSLAGLGSEYQSAVSELNIEILGINGNTASDIMSWYLYKNNREGWNLEIQESDSGRGWSSYICGWTKLAGGRLVLAVDGTQVEGYTGYDTVVITSHAPIWVYEQYFQ